MRAAAWLPLVALLALSACFDGALSDPGADLDVQLSPGQRVDAPLPAEGERPNVSALDVRSFTVIAGERGKWLAGRVTKPATAVLVSWKDAPAHWVVPVRIEDPSNPGELGFELLLDVAERRAPGPLELRFQAIDAAGHSGPRRTLVLDVRSPVPEGELVVSLAWSAAADLDLRIATPEGVLLGPENPSTWIPPRPGDPPAGPDAAAGAGVLDVDGLADCDARGRRRESALWRLPPPRGRYRAFVALAHACGQPRADFTLELWRNGQRVQRRADALFHEDARFDPTQPTHAPGLLALEFDVE